MKIGKISEAVLKRSVLRLISHKNEQIIVGGAVGQDCAVIDAGDRYILTSTECALTGERYAPYFAVLRGAGNIAACGGTPVSASAAFILSAEFDEKRLKELTVMVNDACRECGIGLSGGHTELTDNARADLMTVTVTGSCPKDRLLSLKRAAAGMAVIATKWIAMEETVYLQTEHREKLLERLSESYVAQASEIFGQACILKEARIAAQNGAVAMHDVAGKGIFAALWELSAGSGCGLNIDLRAIPVRQETIEFCELFGINPYEAASAGCMLIVTENPGHMLNALTKEKIPAVLIGYLTEDNDKKLVNNDEIRYLDRP